MSSSTVCSICQSPQSAKWTACHHPSPHQDSGDHGVTNISPVQRAYSAPVSPDLHLVNNCQSQSLLSEADGKVSKTFNSQQSSDDAQPHSSSFSHPHHVCPVSEKTCLLSLNYDHDQDKLECLTKENPDTILNSKTTSKLLIGTSFLKDKNRLRRQFSTKKRRLDVNPCGGKKRIFQCQLCNAIFKKHCSLKQHIISTHKDNAPFVCQLFGQICTDSTDLNNHTQIHHMLFKCSACTETFTNDAKYKAHVRKQHPGVKPHQCQQCDKAYTSKQSLSSHCQKVHADSPPQAEGILNSEGNGLYKCRACDALFHRQSLLKVHVASHRAHIPFLCNVCGLPCHDSQGLSEHMEIHTPFKCPICEVQFAHNTKYTAHVRKLHPDVKPHKCAHCDMAFHTRKWLTVHRLKHTGERPHLCPECGRSFTEAQVLQRHRLAMHQRARRYSCSKCNKTFKTSSALAYHRRSHSRVNAFLCDECGKTFLCPRSLMMHKKQCKIRTGSENQERDKEEGTDHRDDPESHHSNVKCGQQRPFVCPNCGSSFKGEQWLYRHLVNKPASCSKNFACQFCPRTFKDNKNFVRHIRVHTGEKPFACDVCKARFTTRSDLCRHSRTHTNIKPYACKQCDLSFRFRCDLTTHLRTHNGETPYQCAHCDSAFVSASRRLQHMRSNHRSVVSKAKSVKHKQKKQLTCESKDREEPSI